MRRTASKEAALRDEVISLRASRIQKALIDRAAEVLGKSRSDFMLETACREAETVLLDRRYFALYGRCFPAFYRHARQTAGGESEATAAAPKQSAVGSVNRADEIRPPVRRFPHRASLISSDRGRGT